MDERWIRLALLVLIPAALIAFLVYQRRRQTIGDGGCGKCGYPTLGLPSPYCPECGSDLRTVGVRRPTRWNRMSATSRRWLAFAVATLWFAIGWPMAVAFVSAHWAPGVLHCREIIRVSLPGGPPDLSVGRLWTIPALQPISPGPSVTNGPPALFVVWLSGPDAFGYRSVSQLMNDGERGVARGSYTIDVAPLEADDRELIVRIDSETSGRTSDEAIRRWLTSPFNETLTDRDRDLILRLLQELSMTGFRFNSLPVLQGRFSSHQRSHSWRPSLGPIEVAHRAGYVVWLVAAGVFWLVVWLQDRRNRRAQRAI